MTDKKDINLAASVNEALSTMIDGNIIKGIIEKQLEATITRIISDSMESYSDFGKAIKEKINSVIHLAASNVELPEYTKFVSSVVLDQFDKVLKEQAQEQLKNLIAKELGVLPTGSISAQHLLDKIHESFDNDEEYQDERLISVELDNSRDNAIYIKICDKENSEEIKLSLYNHRDKGDNYYIGYIESGGWNARSTKTSERSFNTHCMDSVEKFLFRLYCAQTNIDMSEKRMFDDFTVGGYDH